MDQEFEAFDCSNCSHYQYQTEDSYIEEQDVYTCERGCGFEEAIKTALERMEKDRR